MSKQHELLQLLKDFFEHTLAHSNSLGKSNEEIILNLKNFNDKSDEILITFTNMSVFKVAHPINDLLYDLFLTAEDMYSHKMVFKNLQKLNERINTIHTQSENILTIINPLLDTMNKEAQPQKNKI